MYVCARIRRLALFICLSSPTGRQQKAQLLYYRMWAWAVCLALLATAGCAQSVSQTQSDTVTASPSPSMTPTVTLSSNVTQSSSVAASATVTPSASTSVATNGSISIITVTGISDVTTSGTVGIGIGTAAFFAAIVGVTLYFLSSRAPSQQKPVQQTQKQPVMSPQRTSFDQFGVVVEPWRAKPLPTSPATATVPLTPSVSGNHTVSGNPPNAVIVHMGDAGAMVNSPARGPTGPPVTAFGSFPPPPSQPPVSVTTRSVVAPSLFSPQAQQASVIPGRVGLPNAVNAMPPPPPVLSPTEPNPGAKGEEEEDEERRERRRRKRERRRARSRHHSSSHRHRSSSGGRRHHSSSHRRGRHSSDAADTSVVLMEEVRAELRAESRERKKEALRRLILSQRAVTSPGGHWMMMGGVEGAPTSPTPLPPPPPTLFTSEPIKLGAGAVGRRSVSPRLRVVSGDKGVEYFPAVPVVQQQQQPPLQQQKQARPSSYGAPPSANRVVYM